MQRKLSKIIFGTSSLGNLYQSLAYDKKLEIVAACLASERPVVFDSAGKYGAGLALETLGRCLAQLGVKSEDVLISNKLGWMRKPLTTKEPTFEPGVWKDLKYDAFQNISYEGIIECLEQGNALLGAYTPQLLSVHDPDEYLNTAVDERDYERKYVDVLEAYRALNDLKKQGRVKAIGVGAKDWKVIRKISQHVSLDWVMIANSMTVYHHPPDLIEFLDQLNKQGVSIINSAVFHGGFLIGSDYFNYQLVSRDTALDKPLFEWRDAFNNLCREFDLSPAAACVYFALQVPGVVSVALNSSSPERTAQNKKLAEAIVPADFWDQMKKRGLLSNEYPYL